MSEIIEEEFGVANISFSRRIIRDGVSAEAIGNMLKALPKGSKLVGIGEYLDRDAIGFMIESNKFKDSTKGFALPEISATFRMIDGEVKFISLDYDKDVLKNDEE